jgi:molecular chaperone HtpG
MTKSMGQNTFALPLKRTLVVNPRNPLIQNAFKIWEKGEKKELAEKICYHVQDLASISSEGLSPEEKEKFVLRSQDLVQEMSQYIV